MSLPVPLGGPQPLPLAAHVPPGGPTAPPFPLSPVPQSRFTPTPQLLALSPLP